MKSVTPNSVKYAPLTFSG